MRALIIDQQGRILVLQRTSVSKTNPDHWELPGGKMDAGETVVDALRREVKEETGLIIDPIEFIIATEQTISDSLIAIHLVLACKVRGGVLHISNEHRDFAWISLPPQDLGILADWMRPIADRLRSTKNGIYND